MVKYGVQWIINLHTDPLNIPWSIHKTISVCRKLCVSFKVHKYEIHYWVSYVKKIGVEIHGQSFALLSGLEQEILCAVTQDELIRRANSEWSVRHLGVEQNNVCIWLCTTKKAGAEVHGTNEADSVSTDKQKIIQCNVASIITNFLLLKIIHSWYFRKKIMKNF